MIKEVDIDSSGEIDFDEFVFIMTDGQGIPESESQRDMEANEGDKELLHKMKSQETANQEAADQARAMLLASHIRKAWKGESRNQYVDLILPIFLSISPLLYLSLPLILTFSEDTRLVLISLSLFFFFCCAILNFQLV